MRRGAPALAVVALVLCAVAARSASARTAVTLPDPCTAVPGTHIATALGMPQPPPGKLSLVLNTETCSYTHKGVVLSVFVGLNSIGFPGEARKTRPVANLPHGLYSTFTNTKQVQVSFYKGDPATGVYGIVRASTSSVSKSHLQTIARDLYASI